MFWYPQVKTTMLRAYILLASVVTTLALHGKDTSVCNGDPVSSGQDNNM